MAQLSAVVVGAGVGGLAAAVALQQAGWTVRVLERSPAGPAAGLGISLWPNALRALGSLGLQDRVRAGAVLRAVVVGCAHPPAPGLPEPGSPTRSRAVTACRWY